MIDKAGQIRNAGYLIVRLTDSQEIHFPGDHYVKHWWAAESMGSSMYSLRVFNADDLLVAEMPLDAVLAWWYANTEG